MTRLERRRVDGRCVDNELIDFVSGQLTVVRKSKF